MLASSEHAWDPMAASSANFCLKTRTARGIELLVVPTVIRTTNRAPHPGVDVLCNRMIISPLQRSDMVQGEVRIERKWTSESVTSSV
jgi:hypothetical protein